MGSGSKRLWRVENGELDGLNPKLIVVTLSNLTNGDYSVADMVAGVKELIGA